MDSTYPDSIQHQCFLQPCCFVNFLLYTCIYFLPETGNTTHQCRTNFLNRCLNIRRTEIDTNLHSFMNTEITPCFLKHVCQGEEVHRYILIRHGRQTVIVCMKLFQITGMMKHDALRFTRCAGCIENVCQVIVWSPFGTFFYRIIVRQSLSHRHKLIKIDRRYVAGIFHYRTVKNNQLLQRGAETKDAESSIILVLLAYKKETNLRIINDILRLRRWTRCIKRNSNSPIGKRAKVDIEPFRFILWKYTDILLFFHSQCHESISCLPYCSGELLPWNRNPLSCLIVTVF